MSTSSTPNEPRFSLLWACAALGALVGSGCGGKVDDSASRGWGSTGGVNATISAGSGEHQSGGSNGLGGGLPAAGGVSSSVVLSVSGGAATGGTAGTGTASCSTPTAAVATNCSIPTSMDGSFLRTGNYFTLSHFSGYGYVYVAPNLDSNDTVHCDLASTRNFGDSNTALCGAGMVPMDCTQQAIGGFGFNLRGSQQPVADTINSMVFTFKSTTTTKLRIQVGSYCYSTISGNSPIMLNATDFTTTCWDSANRGTAWDGTSAQSIQMIIPSDATSDTPFDMCLQNVTFSTTSPSGTGGGPGADGTNGAGGVTTISSGAGYSSVERAAGISCGAQPRTPTCSMPACQVRII